MFHITVLFAVETARKSYVYLASYNNCQIIVLGLPD